MHPSSSWIPHKLRPFLLRTSFQGLLPVYSSRGLSSSGKPQPVPTPATMNASPASSLGDPSFLSTSPDVRRRTLENLSFDNVSLQVLPLDPIPENYVRERVPNSCFSRVKPTPLENPRLVGVSADALALLDLDPDQIQRPDFAQYMCGNKVLPGAEPAAHCYCGHQFGMFSGQLGDGATMYLGEIINRQKERWEIQFKGAGLTPYSRNADGRKVLRSSIREFLCSEANFFLGIPTTRAGSVVTSDSRVVRDILYNGNPIRERCTVITRIAPTFFRFGSFEIFKPRDPITGRAGPSAGNKALQKQLIDHVCNQFFPEIKGANEQNATSRHLAVFREIVVRTAKLVASWQAYGFCHGVLNTDNMSIVGLTIDYGPYGFMEPFDREYVCNGSDNTGRYSYAAQPAICKWNLHKLSEAWSPTVPVDETAEIVSEEYDSTFEKTYHDLMFQKLGLINPKEADAAADRKLLNDLLDLMEATAADWSHTFRSLSHVARGECLNHVFENHLVANMRGDPKSMAEALRRKANAITLNIPPRQLLALLQIAEQNPAQLAEIVRGAPPEAVIKELRSEFKKLQRNSELITAAEELEAQPADQKAAADKEKWMKWLTAYQQRLEMETDRTQSAATMDRVNPAFILRNHVLQKVIDAAEKGDYAPLREVLDLCKRPFDELPECSPYKGTTDRFVPVT